MTTDSQYAEVEQQRRTAASAVRNRTRGGLSEEVAAYVRQLILTGVLLPGERIDQEAISADLDVSRSPIREAVVMLGKEGLVDVRPRRGAAVADLTPDDIIDHYELFGLVAGRAASMAAKNLAPEQLLALREIHNQFAGSPNIATSASTYSELNERFHAIINSVAPRRTKWLLGHLVRSVPSNYYEFAEGWDQRSVDHHARILAAIESGDADEARSAMEHHLHESGIAAAEALRGQGFWSSQDRPDRK